MNIRTLLTAGILPLFLLGSCGYHLGGLRNDKLKDMDSFCVNMFANHTVQPEVASLMTTALGDAMQRDGSFRMAAPSQCDFTIDGAVTSISREALSTDWRDSYISREIGMTVHVSYDVKDTKTGQTILSGSTSAQGSYFNDTGNIQSARSAALSYATRQAADNIVFQLTIP